MGESEKQPGATGFQDPWKGGWEPGGPSRKSNCLRRARLEATGVYSQLPEGQKNNSG